MEQSRQKVLNLRYNTGKLLKLRAGQEITEPIKDDFGHSFTFAGTAIIDGISSQTYKSVTHVELKLSIYHNIIEI